MENELTEVQAEVVVNHLGQNESVFDLLKRLGKETWTFYKKHLSAILGISVITTLGLLVAAGIAGDVPETNRLTPELGIFSLLYLVAYILVYLGMYMFVSHEGSIGVKESFAKGLRMARPLGWLFILSSVMLTGGFLLLVIPGIYLMPAVMIVNFIFLKENIRGRDALVRAWGYVSGRWWQTFLSLLIALVLIEVAGNIVGTIFKSIHKDWGEFVRVAFGDLISTPLSIIFSYFMYKHLAATAGEPSGEENAKHKKRVTILAVLGILALLLLFLAFGWALRDFGSSLMTN